MDNCYERRNEVDDKVKLNYVVHPENEEVVPEMLLERFADNDLLEKIADNECWRGLLTIIAVNDC